MEFAFDFEVREGDESAAEAGDGCPPPPEIPERPTPWGPDPAADMRLLTWALLGGVAGLGVLKLALFTVGGAVAASVLGAVFVAAHGLLLAAGGAWFWEHRYQGASGPP